MTCTTMRHYNLTTLLPAAVPGRIGMFAIVYFFVFLLGQFSIVIGFCLIKSWELLSCHSFYYGWWWVTSIHDFSTQSLVVSLCISMSVVRVHGLPAEHKLKVGCDSCLDVLYRKTCIQTHPTSLQQT